MKNDREKDVVLSSMVCDVGECLTDEGGGLQWDAKEHTVIHTLCPLALQMDVQSSSPSLLGDSLTLLETSSANEADEFPTASQNSVLLTLDHTDGNP